MKQWLVSFVVGAAFSLVVVACGEGSDEKIGEGEAEAEAEAESEGEAEAESEAEAEGEGDCGPSDLSKNYDGFECGLADICFESEDCCNSKGVDYCGSGCGFYEQDCDGPEDCAGGVCCLQSLSPKPTEIVCSTCCDYVAPSKAGVVTRACHDSTECPDTAAPFCCSAYCSGCSGNCYDAATAADYEKSGLVCDN